MIPLPQIEREQARRRQRFLACFPEAGPNRRELYAKHLDFFSAGAKYLERLFMAANRVGKTWAGAYESVCHATGLYPAWWTGWRFTKETHGWACGTNGETTRNIVQGSLLGPVTPEGSFTPGTGMLPAESIAHHSPRPHGLRGSVEMIWVKHISGGISTIAFRTYEQGRQSFEGDAKDWIWDDEEPPEDVYAEQVMRVLTTGGRVYTTFTPLQGISSVVKSFIEPSDTARTVKYYVQAGWNDVPHLDEKGKSDMAAGMPPHQARARMHGEPSLGSGAIYPISEDDVLCRTFHIPDDWMRSYALDVGWNRTAVLWQARNPANGNIVLYDEHYQGQGEPASHAAAIRARGEWIKGVIDPAARGRSQIDGRQLLKMYTDLGLDLAAADNSLEAGIQQVWQALVSGRLKAMAHLQQWRREFGRYHRDDKGKIPSQDDHLMDTMRYGWMSGRDRLELPPRADRDEDWRPRGSGSADAWMR